MPSYSRALACVALALALGACSQSAPRKPAAAPKPAAPKAVAVVPQPDPDAVVQSAVAEPSPVFDEEYHGPDQGSLESVTALFARGYIESAMRETMLAAVHSDYPLLGMRDVRLTDPVAKFLPSAQARHPQGGLLSFRPMDQGPGWRGRGASLCHCHPELARICS